MVRRQQTLLKAWSQWATVVEWSQRLTWSTVVFSRLTTF
jgi:hypothetical protein